MDELSAVFLKVRAVRDCETVRTLLMDVWELSQLHGHAKGVLYAGDLLRAVERYARERHEFEVRSRMPGYTAGNRDPGYTEEVDG